MGDFPRLTRPDANQVIDAAAAKREENLEPDFSFPNMEQAKKAHLGEWSLLGSRAAVGD